MIDFCSLSHCPECNSLWHEQPIPEKSQHLFGDAKFFSRVIGMYSREQDRTIAWQCPDCHAYWDRSTGKLQTALDLAAANEHNDML